MLLICPLALAATEENAATIEAGRRAVVFIATARTPAPVSPAEWSESDASYSSEGADRLLREAQKVVTKQETALGFFVIDGTRGDDFSFEPATGRLNRVTADAGASPACMVEVHRQQDGRVRGMRVSVGLIALGSELGPEGEVRFLGA